MAVDRLTGGPDTAALQHEIDLLNRLARATTERMPPGELFSLAAAVTRELLDADTGVMVVQQRVNRYAQPLAFVTGVDADPTTLFPRWQPLLALIPDRSPPLLLDVRDPAVRAALPDPEIRHVLAVPLHTRTQRPGTLIAVRTREEPFGPGALRAMESLGRQCSLVVDSIRWQRIARNRARVIERAIADATGIVAVLEGPDHRLALATNDLLSFCRRSNRPVLSRPLREILMPQAAEVLLPLLDGAFAGCAADVDLSLTDPATGQVRHYHVSCTPLRDAEETIYGVTIVGNDLTGLVDAERRLAETARRASEHANELQAVFESAADLIVVTDVQGNIYRMNRPAAALVPSLDPNSRHRVGTFARLLNFRKLDGSRLRREEFATIRALSGEAVFGAVRRATAPDGRELVLQINAAPIRNADGTVAGAVAAARDITELYQAQERLREALTAEETQRRRLSAVIQAMPQPVLLADAATGRVVLANQGAAAFWDPELQQVELQSVYDACFIDGTAGRREQHPLYAALHVGATFTREMQVRDRDGRHVPMLVTAAPVLDRQGRPAGAVCVFQPIGELKEKERQLEDLAAKRARLLEAIRHEQQFLDAITASMTEGLLVIDREGTLAHCNPKASALLGRPLERLVGRPVSRLWQELGRAGFRPDDLDRLREALASPRDVPPFELTVPGHGGREVRATVFPIHNGGRTPLGSGLLLHDLTPEREAERLQSRFLSLISQELRTPLAVIKGTVTTLLQTADVTRPEELADSLNLVDQQSDRLHHLIGGILDMARIEAGALKPAVRPLDLAPLVREAVAARERADPDAAVRVHVPAQLPPVMGDPARLRQVLDHLLDNALRHARHPDGVTITAEADGGVLRVVVSDDGEGIPPQEQERIFRRFYQVRQAPPGRRYGGLGLGLAICRGIVEAHGGRIWVESQPGKGTAFTFTLPLLAAEAEPAPEAARPAARLVQRERKQQILVVDDDVQTVRLLTTSLKPLGFTVVPARTGEAALELIQLQPPDLVILELSLPDMTGFDLCRQIRQLSGVPVLVLTAREGVEDKATALDLGADDYLTKPFSVTELAARIRVALRRAESAETVRAPDTFTAGRLHINFTDRSVMVDGRPVAVTATEYRLLRELALNAGRVLTQEQILTRVWGESYSNEGELLRSYIRRLRSKLDDRPPHSTLIRTHRGIGYGLVRP